MANVPRAQRQLRRSGHRKSEALIALFAITLVALGPAGLGSMGSFAGPGGAASARATPTDVLPPCWTSVVAGSNGCTGAVMVYDPVDGYLVVDLICLNATPPLAFHSCTWIYQSGSWVEVTSGPQPPALFDEGFVWDAADGYAILFGGEGYPAGHLFHATWAFRGGSWTNLTSAPELPMAYLKVSAAYDSTLGSVVAVWQSVQTSGPVPNLVYTYRRGIWTNLTASQAPPDSFAFAPLVADDPSERGLLWYGGDSPTSGAPVGTGWLFQNGSWTPISGPSDPPALYGASMTYDAIDAYVLLVGGIDGDCASAPTCDLSSGVYAFDGGHWNNLTATVHGPVPEEWGGAMVTDTGISQVVEAFGYTGPGSVSAPSPVQTSLYEYSNDTWTEVGSAGATSPALELGWIVVGAVVVVAGATIGLLLWRRRRSVPPPPPDPDDVS